MKLKETFKKSLKENLNKEELLSKLQNVCKQYLVEHPPGKSGGFFSTPQKSQDQAEKLIKIIEGIIKSKDAGRKTMAYSKLIENINSKDEGVHLTGNDSLRSCLVETVRIATKNNPDLLKEEYAYMSPK